MIVRKIMYTQRPGKDFMQWIRDNSQRLRAIDGMRRIEFVRSRENPDLLGCLMYFNDTKDLEKYKSAGPYTNFVKSLSEYADPKKVMDEAFDYLEV